MLNTIEYVTGLLGVLAIAQFVFLLRMYKSRGEERRKAQFELQQYREKVEEAERETNSLRDFPPLPSTVQFVRHLSELCDLIRGDALILDDARLRSVGPLELVADETHDARVLSRKARFYRYLEVLSAANIEISARIDHLAACHSAAAALCSLLEKGQSSSAAAPGRQCRAIDETIEALRLEESPDITWRRRIESIKKEFEPIHEARVKRSALERTERERIRTVASLAFEKHKLPPITSLEHFRRIVHSHGQRDNLDLD